MSPSERLRQLLRTLEALRQVNLTVPIVVEGKRDLKALRMMGLEGEIITLHRGRPLYEFSEFILRRTSSVVLLLDWDQRGEKLYERLSTLLEGHFEEYSHLRQQIKAIAEEDFHEVESIPSFIERLSREA